MKSCKKKKRKKEGDNKKKKNVSRFGLPCSSLYSVKQQTTVICTDRLCLSNGTAESHTEPQDRKRVRGKDWEGEKEEADWGTLTEGALVWARDCIKQERRLVGVWRCAHSWVHVYAYDSALAASWQSLFLIGYLILPAFEDVGRANLTAWFFTCHRTQGAMGNLCKAWPPTLTSTSIRTHLCKKSVDVHTLIHTRAPT